MYHCALQCLYPLTILFLTSQLALLKWFSASHPLAVAAPGVQMLLALESHYEDTQQRLGKPSLRKLLWVAVSVGGGGGVASHGTESQFVIQTCRDTTLQHAQADRV